MDYEENRGSEKERTKEKRKRKWDGRIDGWVDIDRSRKIYIGRKIKETVRGDSKEWDGEKKRERASQKKKIKRNKKNKDEKREKEVEDSGR